MDALWRHRLPGELSDRTQNIKPCLEGEVWLYVGVRFIHHSSECLLEVFRMSVDGRFQPLLINLRGPEVLMPQLSCDVLYGYVVGKCQRCERVPGDVEGQVLVELHGCLDKMQIVVSLLVGYSWQLEIILLEHFHCRFEDGSEELGASLESASINIE